MPRRAEPAGLRLPAAIADRLLEHADLEDPNEACALLGGNAGTGRVTSVHLARNELESPYRYSVAPADLVRAMDIIERAGEDLVAIFHSHPTTAPVPSATDRREARYAAIHLIAGVSDGRRTFRAWSLEGSLAVPVRFAIGG